MLLGQAAEDPTLVDLVGEWIVLAGVTVGLILGAMALGAKIVGKWREDEAERAAVQRFRRYFPAEEDQDHSLSVPASLRRGEERFDSIDRQLGELCGSVVPREEVEQRFVHLDQSFDRKLSSLGASIGAKIDGHTDHEDDLASRLEQLVEELIADRKKDP